MHVYQQTVTSQWRYTVFPIVFPVELGCFHLFYPITNYWKYLHEIRTLLRIDYISTCIIHLKCTLLLEDIISWHVGGRFFMAHSVVTYLAEKVVINHHNSLVIDILWKRYCLLKLRHMISHIWDQKQILQQKPAWPVTEQNTITRRFIKKLIWELLYM